MKKSILVVDDDRMQRQIIIDMLNSFSEKYAVLSADSGETACKITEKFIPDLILMDWTMPGMSGSETSLFIKNRESTKHVPIIVITGLSFPEQLAEISTTGIDGYIAKPVSAAELLSSVNKIFND